MNTVRLRHNKIELALHELRGNRIEGARPVLILHALGEHSPKAAPAWTAAWPGAIWALDFTGHGDSTVPAGGGYTAEILLADADIALAHTGVATVVGFGLGAYIALLVAGARPSLVRGLVLADGSGLAGGGTEPSSAAILGPAPGAHLDVAPDPYAFVEMTRDVRPPDYATAFVRQAVQASGAESPIAVCSRSRPPWLAAVVREPGVVEVGDLATALALYR